MKKLLDLLESIGKIILFLISLIFAIPATILWISAAILIGPAILLVGGFGAMLGFYMFTFGMLKSLLEMIRGNELTNNEETEENNSMVFEEFET